MGNETHKDQGIVSPPDLATEGFVSSRRRALASLLTAGAVLGVGRARGAEPAHSAIPAPKDQPNNAHAEPANHPGGAAQPVVKTQADYFYRPNIHYSPSTGFMNDPNGLIFDGERYHLYYQYDPFSPYAGRVHWGHATSTDLYTWQDAPIAIDETPAGEAYTGCVVMDRNNVSGLFPPKTAEKTSVGAGASGSAVSVPTATQEAVRALAPKMGKETSDAPYAPEAMSALKPNADKPFGTFYAPEAGPVASANANTSGLPPMAGGMIALYTRATPQKQSQYIAWSPDGGNHFIDYDQNPALDLNMTSFRDPKVFWHDGSQKWVMVVAKSREHRIAFFGSIDLKHWMHLSDFGPAGLFGVDYECPNLLEVEIEGQKGVRRWVLFVSVNPGGPQGGSVTQYFIGNFDGERFIPENTVIGLTDFAKDSYAMQVYNDFPENKAVYFAWFGNWQYCEEVPNRSWRGLMSLPREMSLRHDDMNWLRLVQRPYGLAALRQPEMPFKPTRIQAQSGVQTSLPVGQAFELSLTATVDERVNAQPDGNQGRAGRFVIVFSNSQGESLSIGFDAFSGQLWLDRGNLHGFSQPFFTERFSTPLIANSRRFNVQIIVDACALEIYANDGLSVGTALIYPANPLETLSLEATNAGATIHEIRLCGLKKTMDRPTAA
ncbi:levanase [Neokomagataea thailandica NBRC 106555]|uniref:Glycoside hydrolase family 32 protein n=2 Tax=Neokomagataea TaxID=1223423 RepID=A0A4Y6V3Z9_9PROT|nr:MULTISPECIES: glycoside hydrolase family 32 protein [Neokomagataea]QDH24789.1 glycoside hydrolase family 32 protein [Neokomagataea tanensis]GBR52704.1 levanase [Neokomagataea thailandica NBRC 106555]